MSALQAQADQAMVVFDRVVSGYRFNSVGLTVNPKLLEHVNKVMRPRKGTGKTKSIDIPVEEFCNLLKEGKGRYNASNTLGIDPQDVKRKMQFDQSFRDKVLMAEEEASEKIEEKLWGLAQSGERWAMELWLKRRYKDRWGDEPNTLRIEGEVQHNHEIGTGSVLEQIAAIASVLQNRAQLTMGSDIIELDEDDIIEG